MCGNLPDPSEKGSIGILNSLGAYSAGIFWKLLIRHLSKVRDYVVELLGHGQEITIRKILLTRRVVKRKIIA